MDATRRCIRAENFGQKQHLVWMCGHSGPNQNWLRCTRVLRCLRLLGEEERCVAFFNALKNIYDEGIMFGSSAKTTMSFWQEERDKIQFVLQGQNGRGSHDRLGAQPAQLSEPAKAGSTALFAIDQGGVSRLGYSQHPPTRSFPAMRNKSVRREEIPQSSTSS